MEDGKKPPKKSNKRPLAQFKVVKKQAEGSKLVPKLAPTKDQVEAIFLASKHTEWTPFAQSMGWDPARSRTDYPSALWIQKKKQILAIQQAEHIAEQLWDHRGQWHRDVLKTLKEMPEANDAMLGIVKHRLNNIIGLINEDKQNKVLSAQTGQQFEEKFQKVTSQEIAVLAGALKTITEAKHKSVMLDNWSMKVAEEFTDPGQFQAAEDKAADNEWTVEILGGEKMSMSNMESFMARYYDQKTPKELLKEAKEIIPGENRTAAPPTAYPELHELPEES